MEQTKEQWIPCYATDDTSVYFHNDYFDYVMPAVGSAAFSCLMFLLQRVARDPAYSLHAAVTDFAGRDTRTGLTARTVAKALIALESLHIIDILPGATGRMSTYRVCHREEWDVSAIDAILAKQYSAAVHERRIRTDSHYPLIRLKVIERDQSTCVYCHQVADDPQIDHIIPVCRGGTNEFANLVTTCPACNMSKGRKTPEEWRTWIQERQERP